MILGCGSLWRLRIALASRKFHVLFSESDALDTSYIRCDWRRPDGRASEVLRAASERDGHEVDLSRPGLQIHEKPIVELDHEMKRMTLHDLVGRSRWPIDCQPCLKARRCISELM